MIERLTGSIDGRGPVYNAAGVIWTPDHARHADRPPTDRPTTDGQRRVRSAVLLIAHGSRHAPANDDLHAAGRAVRRRGASIRSSRPASWSWPSPTSPTGGDRCVARGASAGADGPLFPLGGRPPAPRPDRRPRRACAGGIPASSSGSARRSARTRCSTSWSPRGSASSTRGDAAGIAVATDEIDRRYAPMD